MAVCVSAQIRMGKVKLKVIRDLSSFEPIPAVSQFMVSALLCLCCANVLASWLPCVHY